LNSTPVPVPFPELYNALEQRVVDCATLPLVELLHARLFEVQKYVSLSDHMMLMQSLLFSQKAWRDLGPEERSLLQEAADEARGLVRRLAQERHARTLTELQARGMVINRLSVSELARMKAAHKQRVSGMRA
jgi:TRAP-type transport system periplasmic protein